MKATRIESPPYVFQLVKEQQPPAGWRVLFRGEFRYELQEDERLPGKFGGDSSRRSDEEVAIASWVLGRLAYLLMRDDGPDFGIAPRYPMLTYKSVSSYVTARRR